MYNEEIMNCEIIFDAKPDAVPYNYRISYKVSLLCLIIFSCCGRKGCSLVKLHMISSALSNNREQKKLYDFCDSASNTYILIHFDPVVTRALLYATSDGLITQQVNGLFKLTEKGKTLVNKIIKEKNIFNSEICYLNSLSTKLTEEKISILMRNWGQLYVEDK